MAGVLISEADSKLAPVNGDHEILYADRPTTDEQLLIKQPLWETKYANMASGLKLKFTFRFMETTHKPLHL
jgi:hypothetical protein